MVGADHYIAIQAIKRIQSICTSLTSNGIVSFTHDISFPKGELSTVTTDEAVFKYWFNHRLPAICTDDNGRMLDPGVYFGNFLEDHYEDCAQGASIMRSITKATEIVSILETDTDCQHLYTFSFNLGGNELLHWLINNVHQLKNFIEYYKHSGKDIIDEAKKPTNRIVLPIIKEKLSTTKSCLSVFNTKQMMQKIIHKETKIPIFLAKQQSICLTLLMQGKTAKEIALAMNLSYRTVQHYLARIRQILGCASSRELILLYGNQLISKQWDSIRNLLN